MTTEIDYEKRFKNWLESQAFYELCQSYRHAKDWEFEGMQTASEAFEELKRSILAAQVIEELTARLREVEAAAWELVKLKDAKDRAEDLRMGLMTGVEMKELKRLQTYHNDGKAAAWDAIRRALAPDRTVAEQSYGPPHYGPAPAAAPTLGQFDQTAINAKAEALRLEGMEQAAKICAKEIDGWSVACMEGRMAARDCEDAIRAEIERRRKSPTAGVVK